MFRRRNKKDAYKHVVSLGKTCQPALAIRRNKLRTASFPLDWIWSPTESVCSLVKTNFEGFFEKSLLEPVQMTRMDTLEVHNPTLGLVFAHEFKSRETFDQDYEVWKERYDRRISRFYDVLNSREKVLFIRFRTGRDDVETISQMLSSEYPDLPYTILALDDTEPYREDWKLPNVINRHIAAAPEDDSGSRKYNPAWKKLFKDFHFDLVKTR